MLKLFLHIQLHCLEGITTFPCSSVMETFKCIPKLSGSAFQPLHESFLVYNQKSNPEHSLFLSPPIFPVCGCCAFVTVNVVFAGSSKTCLPSCAGWRVGTAVVAVAVLGPGLLCCITHRQRLISPGASGQSTDNRDFLGRDDHLPVLSSTSPC